MILVIPNCLGIDQFKGGFNFEDSLLITMLFAFCLGAILYIVFSKSILKTILITSFVFALVFTTFTTSGYRVIELTDQHTDRNVNSRGSASGAMNYNFQDLNPANAQYDAKFIPPFTIIHSKKGNTYNKKIEARPEWLESSVSGYPLLWFLDPVGASLSGSVNYLHFFANLLFYFVIFFIPNILGWKLAKGTK
jgi:hypothetical protein